MGRVVSKTILGVGSFPHPGSLYPKGALPKREPKIQEIGTTDVKNPSSDRKDMVHGPVAMSEKSKQLLLKLQQNKEETEAIQALWRSFGSGFTPPDSLQCSIWLQRHDLETVIYGLNAMSGHMNRKRQAEEELEENSGYGSPEQLELAAKWNRSNMMRYASACMLRRRERGE